VYSNTTQTYKLKHGSKHALFLTKKEFMYCDGKIKNPLSKNTRTPKIQPDLTKQPQITNCMDMTIQYYITYEPKLMALYIWIIWQEKPENKGLSF